MRFLYVLLSLAAVMFLVVFGLLAYVNNLDEELPSATDTEKKGRAKYLYDIRWPDITFDFLLK